MNNNLNKFDLYFQVPSREVDKSEGRFWSHWNKELINSVNWSLKQLIKLSSFFYFYFVDFAAFLCKMSKKEKAFRITLAFYIHGDLQN